ncbi:hypothetical protein QWY28_20690 [Nocardioides sp. SOB77]|uniref:Low molecular weight protein antigen 6 PH domain-containing protein n=1 Tax=Nocardioides oceani TaxID=3058369 RepID=A0ABT8FL37_9ACTN|nr:PH domain-containing protein [Nocardioides oceani]MDN4175396.1 hypothetical protein [Nocardioides oceani]
MRGSRGPAVAAWRWASGALLLVVALVGVLMLVVGGPLRTVGGAAALGSVAAVLVAVAGPRTPRAGVRLVRVPGGLVLPRRPGHVAALAATAVLGGVAAFGLGAAAVLEDDPDRRVGAAVLYAVPCVLAGLWLLLAGACGRGRMLLTQDALVYRSLLAPTRRYPWADLRGVRADRRAGGVLRFAGDRHRPLTAAGQGADPERLAAVLDHLARARPRRDVLLAPDGPEVVAGWLTGERPLPRR